MKIRDYFKHNSLFVIMFFFTFMSILFVSIIITWTTIRMSEEFFIEKFSIMNEKVINEMKEGFESFHASIVFTSNHLLQSGNLKEILTKKQSNAEKMASYYKLKQLMKPIKHTIEAHEVSINVTGINGLSYSTDRDYWPITDEELMNSKLEANIYEWPNKLLYQHDNRPITKRKSDKESFIVASKSLKERSSGKVYGGMYIAIQETEFDKLYTNFTSDGNDVLIINSNGKIVSSNRKELIGKNELKILTYAKEIANSPKRYVIERFMEKENIFFVEFLPDFDLYIVNIIDKHTAISGLVDKKELAKTLLMIFILVLIIVFFVSKKLTNSLSILVKEIANVSKTNFHQSISVQGTYETRKISITFNYMLKELQDYVKRLVSIQKQKRNAELAALQQQINPHFLYNTLTSIKFMVIQGSKEEAEITTNALISLLQNTVGNVCETITIKKEVENLQDYVLINQKRYGTRITVNYFITPDCHECHIPKLILQPFIENAFFHGFSRKQMGYIHVLVWKEQQVLICEVVDNGDGMEEMEYELPETKSKQERFTGIGIRNVHERLQLIYGDSYGVAIYSKPNEGTRVRISLPVN